MLSGLTKRLVKGAPLTALEGDNNLEVLAKSIEDEQSIPSSFPNADNATLEVVNNTFRVKDDGVGTNQYAPASVDNTAMAGNAVKPLNVASAAAAVVSASNSTAVDWAVSWSFYTTLTENTTFVFSNSKEGQPISVMITQNAGAAKTVAWPVGVLWSNATAPVMSTGLGKRDLYTFQKINGVIWGSAPVQNA